VRIAMGPITTNAFIHFVCAALSAAAMLTYYYLGGREAVATGRNKVCQ
jgi:hypothetical protein